MSELRENKKTIEQLLSEEKEKERAKLNINLKHIEAGVTFIDWNTAYIDESVVIGAGTTIGPGVILSGNTVIGCNCVIGHNTKIVNSIIADEVDIQASIILESRVGNRTKIGPFAYIRPNSQIGDDAKVGDFVEVKNSTMANGAKASHLTYIGDSDIGEGVNLGCGVVFVNYDGTNKHRSVVEEGAFIGCNTNLISPVTVGKGAYVAAGTTVTKNVPPGALCVGRQKDRCIEGWVEKRGLLKKKK
jgi:bifunctional UDP-N-acetylglucosamine pyrophosphorylase / glucosamine-1-phosphate N-acetyltransferase